MPLYEYVCRECGSEYELRLRYEERLAGQECPACGSARTLLRMSAATVVGGAAARPAPAGGSCCGGACGCGH